MRQNFGANLPIGRVRTSVRTNNIKKKVETLLNEQSEISLIRRHTP